jgi:hypothetical protein
MNHRKNQRKAQGKGQIKEKSHGSAQRACPPWAG